jgi:hypothetical protein
MTYEALRGRESGSAMRRRKLLVVLAGLAVVVAAGVAVLWPRPARVTPENYLRIEAGMTLAEVAAILGAPPGDFEVQQTLPYDYNQMLAMRQGGFHKVEFEDFWPNPHEFTSETTYQHWFGSENAISVGFREGRAVSKCRLWRATSLGQILARFAAACERVLGVWI